MQLYAVLGYVGIICFDIHVLYLNLSQTWDIVKSCGCLWANLSNRPSESKWFGEVACKRHNLSPFLATSSAWSSRMMTLGQMPGLPRSPLGPTIARFGWPLLEGCGITEIGGYYAAQPLDGSAPAGSMGRPTVGTQLRLVEEMAGRGFLYVFIWLWLTFSSFWQVDKLIFPCCFWPFGLGIKRDHGTIEHGTLQDGREVAAGCVGEVMLKTGSLPLGYWEDQEATEQLFQDGDWTASNPVGRCPWLNWTDVQHHFIGDGIW